MSISRMCIKKPVTTFMFYIGVVMFGVISLTFLKQELYPSIVYPRLSVVTNYENAAPEEIETLITKPIEEAVGSTAGLRSVSSISREGLSVVIAEFGWDENMDFAALGIREKIDLMKARLPRDSEEPTVIKYNPYDLPVITLSISSDNRSPVRLKRFVEKWFKDEIEKITGVASATLSGGEDEEIHVKIDQGRLKATNLGVNDISKAISTANLNYPGGTIKESFYEYLVRTMGQFKDIDEINKVPISTRDSAEDERQGKSDENQTAPTPEIVLISDVADVTRTVQKTSSFSRYNGRENVTVKVQKQANANTIKVAKDIQDKLDEISRSLPEDITVDVVYNQADFIRSAIGGVKDAALQGGILVFLVLLFFLRKIATSTFVVVITPITLFATFTLMYAMGISLNVISLGGIVLSIGMLVDSAIVVMENVDRRIGINPDADFENEVALACDEIVMPLAASTMTTVSVFLPMIFVTGIAGQIFKQLAWVVIVTQIISIAVAFTLLPVLIVKFGRNVKSILNKLGDFIVWTQKVYADILEAFLKRKGFYLLCTLMVLLFSILLLTRLDRILMPKVDQGQFMIKIDIPVGAKVEVTNEIAKTLEGYLRDIPEIKDIAVIVGSSKGKTTQEAIQQLGSHQSELMISLKQKRRVSTNQLIQRIRADIGKNDFRAKMKGASISFVLYDSVFGGGSDALAPIVINITGNNLSVMKQIADDVKDKVSGIEGIFDTEDSFPERSPETKIEINKDRSSFYRLSVTDIATAAHLSIKGIVASNFREEGREIPIRVLLRDTDVDTISKLPFVLMHSPLGISIPLAELVKFTRGHGPSEIKRIGQERTIQVLAKITNRSLNDVTSDVRKVLNDTKLPKGYYADLVGATLEVKESFNSLRMALILSIILVYMIMAAQFESYLQPFIIMFTVPLALIGVAVSLWLTGTPISVIVLLGVLLLGGIVVNNGIILIDFINQSVKEGKGILEATMQGARVRFRPILMTALSTILGLFPLALGLGEGAKLQSPMAIAVMGGLFASTFLTLLVIPAIYAASAQMMKTKEQ